MDEKLIWTGIACIIASIVGGGLKAFEIEIPLFTNLKRQMLLGAVGLIILITGVIMKNYKPNEKAIPETYVLCDSTMNVNEKELVLFKGFMFKIDHIFSYTIGINYNGKIANIDVNNISTFSNSTSADGKCKDLRISVDKISNGLRNSVNLHVMCLCKQRITP